MWGILGLGSPAPVEAADLLACRADISILLAIECKGRSGGRATRTRGLLEQQYMRLDLTLAHSQATIPAEP